MSRSNRVAHRRLTLRPKYRPGVEYLEDRLTPVGDPLVDLLVPGVTAIQSVGGVLTATLTMAPGPSSIDGSPVVDAWTYNGAFVGPTLIAQPGDLLDITIINNLPAGELTNLHTHGLHVSPIGNSDNVLLQILPGEDNHYQIQIPDDHVEGLYWYHPHHHGNVFDQISHGLSGLMVIGRADGGAPQLDGLPQTALALKNVLLAGNQVVVPAEGSLPSAQTFTVNGQVDPVLAMQPNEWRVFNVANIGNNSFYSVQVFDQFGVAVPIYSLAEDGNPFTHVQQPIFPSLGLPPGRRWSFTFQPPTGAAVYELRTLGFNAGPNLPLAQWPAETLMTFNFSGTPLPVTTPVTAGMALTPANQNYRDLRLVPDGDIAAHRTVVFTNDGEAQMINGDVYPNNPVYQPRLNTVEEWTLVNDTDADHPFHMHVNPQQVVQAPSAPNLTGLPQWQDVINVPAGNTVVIRIEFLDFLGEFVYHCHRVDHEDHGMMALVNVIPEEPIYATGANAGKQARVKVFNPVTATQVASFLAFGSSYTGGINVAVGDVNGDGVYDVVIGRERGKGHVKIVDGTQLDQVDPNTGVILDSALLGNFTAYNSGGVFVAAGDIDANLGDEIVVGRASGAGKVKIFNPDGTQQNNFYAFGQNFAGGVRVTTGDLNGDGRIDVIAGKGPGGKSKVKVFDDNFTAIASFLAFGKNFNGGVYLATGNTKGFGFSDIIVSKGPGSKPHVKVFSDEPPVGHEDHDSHLHIIEIDSFFAYGENYRGGVRVTSLHDPALLAPYGGNQDQIVTTKATGNDDLRIF